MTKKHSTKKALMASVLSLLLCFSMLVGTTFAWFTDSVTSANNIIKSGNLDIELKYAKIDGDKITGWDTVGGKDNIFDKNALWEPGRVEVVYLEVSNLGTLALKYQLGINVVKETPGVNVAGEEFKLSDHLVFKVVSLDEKPTEAYTREEAMAAAGAEKGLKDYNGITTPLEVDGEDYVALIVYMPETVGNEANYRGEVIPQITLGINLYATQQMAEEDSFGSDYDEGANHEKFKVTNANELQNAANDAKPGDVIEIVNDLVLTEPIVIPAAQATFSMRSTPAPVVIDLNGKTISADESTYAFNNLGNLILTDSVGSGFVKARGIYNGYGQGGENVSSAYMFVDNVTINALGPNGGAAIFNYGIVEIENSEFSSIGGYALNNQAGGKMTLSNSKATGGIYNMGELTVNNSTVYQHISGRHAIYNWSGSVVINDGKYDSISGNELILADGEGASVVINGGTFDKTAKSWLFGAATGKNITFVINGGTFNGYVNLPENTVDTIRPYNDPIVVYGGTFNFNPTNWIAEGYKAVQNSEGKYIVITDDYAGVIYNVDQLTQAAANGGEYLLVADLQLTQKVTIPSGVEVTLDLNDKTIAGTMSGTGNQDLFLVNGNLTVKNGTIELTATQNQGWNAMSSIFDITAGGVVTLDEVIAENKGGTDMNFVAHLNNWGTATLNVTDSTLKATYVAVRVFNSGYDMNNVTITNSTLSTEGNAAFWVHNYTAADFGTQEKADKQAKLLNFKLEGNTYIANKAAFRYGMTKAVYKNEDGNQIVFSTTELINAIKNAPVGKETVILMADGNYDGDIAITVEALGASGGDVVIKALGKNAVITGAVTLGYRNQGVGAEMYNANVTFEGVTFNHAESGKHSLYIQDVKSLTLINCTIIGDGEYGIDSARGNATGTSKITNCTFVSAGMQLLGNFATGLVIDGCTFNESRINVQAGNGVTVQNCEFNNTLTAANVGDSFYAIRSNSTPITVKDCEMNIDSKLTEVATAQAKWYLLANRGTTNWTVENVAVTLTEAALAQTELKITACTSTGVINTTNLTVNGVAK